MKNLIVGIISFGILLWIFESIIRDAIKNATDDIRSDIQEIKDHLDI